MNVYKELYFRGNEDQLRAFKMNARGMEQGDWKYVEPELLKDYIVFDYTGNKVESSEVSIYCGLDAIRERKIRITNIVPLKKTRLSIDEYNAVLDLFYDEIVKPNQKKLSGLDIEGPCSAHFNPENYISKKALEKLRKFNMTANKSSWALHPCDEERWFDFICQTVLDGQKFDYTTIYRFLMDEEYWQTENVWSEEDAACLASEYDNYVRILEYFISMEQDHKRSN